MILNLVVILILICECELREKRQLIYVNSGVFKFILGVGIPVNIEIPGGSLGWLGNIQGLYRLPDNITYFQPYRIISKRSLANGFNRQTLYSALSKSLTRLGMNGDECLRRIICEVARGELNRESNGLIGELIHVLFSPLYESHKTSTAFKNAQLQGLNNSTECDEIFGDCTEANVLFSD